MIALPRPCICLVTDRRALTPDARTTRDELVALDRFLDEAIDAGVDLIQIRERDVDAAALLFLVRRVVERAGTGTKVVVNDRADVAIAAGAGGVHLPANGPAASQLRQLTPNELLIGRSIHSAGENDPAADYLLFGTVYPSASKPEGAPVAGISALADAVRASPLPVLAIGGVTPERVPECRAAGAAGIAAIGIFLPEGRRPDAMGPRRAVAEIREQWGEGQRSEVKGQR